MEGPPAKAIRRAAHTATAFLLLLGLVACSNTRPMQHSAKIIPQKRLEAAPDSPEKCRLLPGEATVLLLTRKQRKAFFRSDNRHVEEFLIQLPEIGPGDTTLQLPLPDGQSCYKSGFHAVTFLDFQPTGTLYLHQSGRGITGNIDAKVANQLDQPQEDQERSFSFEFKVED